MAIVKRLSFSDVKRAILGNVVYFEMVRSNVYKFMAYGICAFRVINCLFHVNRIYTGNLSV